MTTLMERMGVDIEALRDQAASAGFSAMGMLQDIAANPIQGLANSFTAVGELAQSGLDTVTEIYANSFHGQLDALQSLSPADQFQGITDLLVENGQTEIVTQLNALPENLQETFATNLVNDFDFRISVIANASAENAGATIGSEVLARHLDTLPLEDRFEAFQGLQSSLGSFLEADTATQLNRFTERLDGMPEGIQQSFMHAFTENEGFREYIIAEASVDGGSDFVNDLFDGLYRNGVEAQGFDPNRVGAVQDILNTIGNNPENNPAPELNAIKNSLEALDRATTPEAETAAELALFEALRDAGGNLPAFANLQADPSIGFAFLSNLLDPNIDAARAMDMFADDLGLTGEQLIAFQEQFGPFAEILETFIQPYASVIQEHGPRISRNFAEIGERNNIISGDRVAWIEHDGNGTDVDRTGAAPEAGNMTREQLMRAAGVEPANVDGPYVPPQRAVGMDGPGAF